MEINFTGITKEPIFARKYMIAIGQPINMPE
jgi:hypothetical protein